MEAEVASLLRQHDVRWSIIRSHNTTHGHIRCQLEGFNHFMRVLLPCIVGENSDIVIESTKGNVIHTIQFNDVTVFRPNIKESDGVVRRIWPSEARTRRLNYSCSVVADVVHRIEVNGELTEEHHRMQVPLFRIPCMVRSDFCWLSTAPHREECVHDQGGYFVVNGIDKVLQPQLKLRHNRIYVWANKAPKTPYVAEIRSCHPSKWRSTSTLRVHLHADVSGRLHFTTNLPFVMRGSTPIDIPVEHVFRMCAVMSVRDMHDATILPQDPVYVSELLLRTFNASIDMESSVAESARAIVADHRGMSDAQVMTQAMQIIRTEFLPHVGLDDAAATLRAKAVYFGMVVRKLTFVAVHSGKFPHITPPDRAVVADDRDHNMHKRLDASGSLLAILFRQLWRAHLKYVKQTMTKAVDSDRAWINVIDYIKSRRIEVGWRYHFSTGNWSLNKQLSSTLTGVVQMKNTASNWAGISHLRRVSIPLNRDGKTPKPRQLDASDYGVYCASETPEGQSCGLIKSLAILAHVTIAVDAPTFATAVADAVLELDCVVTGVPRGATFALPIMVNGCLVAYVTGGEEAASDVAEMVRGLRRHGGLPSTMSVVHTIFGIYVHADDGRICRPLLNAANLHRFPALWAVHQHDDRLFDVLIDNGVVEYIDKEEEEYLVVAENVDMLPQRPGATYVEIDPNTILGLSTANIVFSHHNQAPRNMYQTSMVKQAIAGPPVMPLSTRYDVHMHALNHPMSALVQTETARDPTLSISSGQECIVAICTYTGFNQEDSIIMNKAAIDRGLGDIMSFDTIKSDLKMNGLEEECFEQPPVACVGRRSHADYSKIGADGLVPIDTFVYPGDVIIGKTSTSYDYDETGQQVLRKVDRSILMSKKNGRRCVVDSVVKYVNRDGHPAVLVRLRRRRSVVVGDKWSSRHGQKGTVGLILAPEDMPFNAETGMIPDMVINPHCIPSRMTVGHLMETLLGKLSAVTGCEADATAFTTEMTMDNIGDALHEAGYTRHGHERFCDGRSGKMMNCLVFVGCTHYQRLKHLVEDKIHSRNGNGPRAVLTRQPLEGRAKEGGLRFGEMERDALLAHGSAAFLQDKMTMCSDAFRVYVCPHCGTLCAPPRGKTFGEYRGSDRPTCTSCGARDGKATTLPYGFKLLWQELVAMGIMPRLNV